MIAYFNGKFLNKEDIHISPDDRGFLFADGLYEVIRSYDGKLFRASDHMERLNAGAAYMGFGRTDFWELIEVAQKLLSINGLASGSAGIYFQISRGVAPRTHSFPDLPVPLTVYVSVWALDTEAIREKQEKGIAVISVPDIRWDRCDMKTTGLTANILASQTATEKGALEAVFVRDGIFLEGSHSSFFAVVDGVLSTAPLSHHILPGVTRKVVLEICRKEKIPAREQPLLESHVRRASEILITATTAEITPVIRLDHQIVGQGVPGELTRRLQAGLASAIKAL